MSKTESYPLDGGIALALSGGGYRAAGFHLGALSYLHDLGWGPKLSQLSTVSGGTFVGAAYVCSLADGQPFDGFARGFYGFLKSTDLVERALERLGTQPPGVPSGREDLIVSIARVYAETFMAHSGGEPRLFGALLEADLPLEEVIFNATEFRRGIAFRFRKSARPRTKIGNYYFDVPKEVAAKIQLADIVAASSCFPGGFEPIYFPVDFAWPGGEVPELPPKLARDLREPLPLMDGGIYDNQGLSSLMEVDKQGDEDLAMVLVSDVNQRSEDLYPQPDPLELGLVGRMKLLWVNRLVLAMIALCVGTVGAVTYLWMRHGAGGLLDVFGYALPIFLAFVTGAGLDHLRRLVRRQLREVPQAGAASWKDLRRLTVDQMVGMLQLRVTSLLALTRSVFMARIRRLVSKVAYHRESYEGKIVANYIYSLQPPSRFDPALIARGVAPPSHELRTVVEVAASMPTTLWFDADRPWELPSLVAAGQATLVYRLMVWVLRQEREEQGRHQQLWVRLTSDWERLLEDPYALLPNGLEEGRPALPPGIFP